VHFDFDEELAAIEEESCGNDFLLTEFMAVHGS